MKLPAARRLLTLVTVGVLVVACSEPLEFADWTMPVPEGTRVVEHAGVSMQERVGRVELVEDLTVGGQPDDPNQMFYRPIDLAVDGAGRIYVVDRGNYRVQVFDAEGAFIATWGRQGQGPGELTDPRWIAVAADRVAILASRQRLSVEHRRRTPRRSPALGGVWFRVARRHARGRPRRDIPYLS